MSETGAQPGSEWRQARTDRLWLDEPSVDDVDDLWGIHGDPASWTHFPQGRHPDRARTAEMVATWRRGWGRDGLSYWAVREQAAGPAIGCGGCSMSEELPWWNLYYRFATAVQGRGYAVEMARAGLDAAHDLAPERAVIAFLLEHNLSSRRMAERLGLRPVWRGPDLGNDDPDAVRLVFCDRDPDRALLDTIDATFRLV